MGIQGNLAYFIQNFLSDRTFFILLNGYLHTDKTFVQEEGVPQGAILSTTLFNVKLNEIAEQLSQEVKCSVYVDDFVIFMKSSTPAGIARTFQISINKISDWARRNGFTICEDKTVAMHFCNCSRHYGEEGFCQNPKIYFDESHETPIKYVEEKKFLGLYWDPQLTFRKHVEYLKNKCTNVLNLMRVLSHTHWGGDSRTLMKIYRSLIRSKLDYGSIVFMKAQDDILKPLDVIHHAGIRLALGAFKSSPVESLYVEANELPLSLRREELAMKYALKIRSNKNNPTYQSLFDIDDHKEKFIQVEEDAAPRNMPLESSSLYLDKLFQDAEIDIDCIKPIKFPKFPAYIAKPVDVCFSLLDYPKKENNPAFLQAKFRELLPSYDGYHHIYTDGSKEEEVASYGLWCDAKEEGYSARIRNGSSIFTAELEGIKFALRYIRTSTYQTKVCYIL